MEAEPFSNESKSVERHIKTSRKALCKCLPFPPRPFRFGPFHLLSLSTRISLRGFIECLKIGWRTHQWTTKKKSFSYRSQYLQRTFLPLQMPSILFSKLLLLLLRKLLPLFHHLIFKTYFRFIFSFEIRYFLRYLFFFFACSIRFSIYSTTFFYTIYIVESSTRWKTNIRIENETETHTKRVKEMEWEEKRLRTNKRRRRRSKKQTRRRSAHTTKNKLCERFLHQLHSTKSIHVINNRE